MSREARSRLTQGVGIPLAALIFLGILIFAFSRILLVVPQSLAPWVALLFAAVILVGCALAALIPGTRGFTFLISVLVATIAVGGLTAMFFEPQPVHSLVEEGEHATAEAPEENQPSASDEPVAEEEPSEEQGAVEGEASEDEGGAGAAPVEIAARDLAFTTSELALPAGTPSTIAFDNQEPLPHNVAIYTEQGGEPLFSGEVVTGPTQVDYQIGPLEPGSYYFQCDVHPTMNGTVTVG